MSLRSDSARTIRSSRKWRRRVKIPASERRNTPQFSHQPFRNKKYVSSSPFSSSTRYGATPIRLQEISDPGQRLSELYRQYLSRFEASTAPNIRESLAPSRTA